MGFNTKQVIVVRKDLNMRKGKLASQCCHASLAVITNLIEKRLVGPWYFSPPIELENWLENSFAKIVVSVNSEEELVSIFNTAKEKGLLCSLIKDNGKTEFNGVPTLTAAAIGPAEVSKIDPITGSLPLY